MSTSANTLRILHRKAIYPDTTGGTLRTLNIARVAREVFGCTEVFSMDNHIDYEGDINGVHVIQEKELHTVSERICYYTRALMANELIVPYTKRAFENPGNALFQIENPLLYPLLKKKRIFRFILDEHNVNWEMSSMPFLNIKEQIYTKIAFSRDKENEKQALKHATQIICCSHNDKEILVNEVPEISDKIFVIPNCVNIREYNPALQSKSRKHPDKKCRILFVGTLSYPPNADAISLICQIIAPHSSLNYQFVITGKNPPKAIHPPENVMFSGYVSDIREVIADVDICIAPIRYGSGTRLKILEYMAMGKPVIATSKGAEGIEYTDGLNIIIENTIEKYPELIQQLIDDEKKCSALGREAMRLIREKYDWDLYQKLLGKIYRDAMTGT